MRVRARLLGAALLPAFVLTAVIGAERGFFKPWTGTGLAAHGIARSLIGRIEDDAMPILVAGGMEVSRSRHTIAGAALGCFAGAAVGAVTAIGAGIATGGAALAMLPAASVVGCTLAGAGGAALGRPLDDYGDLSVLSDLQNDGAAIDARAH